MHIPSLDNSQAKLLRLAARFRPTQGAQRQDTDVKDVISIVEHLMNDGIYADEFAILDNQNLNFFEMLPAMTAFLSRLNWQPLSREAEFRFLTAMYATAGQHDDIFAYHAIKRWMTDVGQRMDNSFHIHCVADRIGAENIYACYYSYSTITGTDLIPSVSDPTTFDWPKTGLARPKTIFAQWIAANPNDLENHRPFDTALLEKLRA